MLKENMYRTGKITSIFVSLFCFMVENELRGAVEVEENRRSGPVATFTTHDEGIERREGEDNPVATPAAHDEGIEKLQVRMN